MLANNRFWRLMEDCGVWSTTFDVVDVFFAI